MREGGRTRAVRQRREPKTGAKDGSQRWEPKMGAERAPSAIVPSEGPTRRSCGVGSWGVSEGRGLRSHSDLHAPSSIAITPIAVGPAPTLGGFAMIS